MRIAALFLWIAVPVALWVCITLYGTPHIIGTYRYAGSSYLPPAERRYIDCSYYGWTGVHTVPAIQDNCSWVRFFKAGS